MFIFFFSLCAAFFCQFIRYKKNNTKELPNFFFIIISVGIYPLLYPFKQKLPADFLSFICVYIEKKGHRSISKPVRKNNSTQRHTSTHLQIHNENMKKEETNPLEKQQQIYQNLKPTYLPTIILKKHTHTHSHMSSEIVCWNNLNVTLNRGRRSMRKCKLLSRFNISVCSFVATSSIFEATCSVFVRNIIFKVASRPKQNIFVSQSGIYDNFQMYMKRYDLLIFILCRSWFSQFIYVRVWLRRCKYASISIFVHTLLCCKAY